MSRPITDEETGVVFVRRGRGDYRFSKDNVGARSEPRMPHGDISLWRFGPDGQRYSLFLSIEEAYGLADAIDALLEYMEEQGEISEDEE